MGGFGRPFACLGPERCRMTEPSARVPSISRSGREVPWLSVVLGYGPMLPFVVGALLAWLTHGAIRAEIVLLTILYTASILLFLAGVRRGLSFRTAGRSACGADRDHVRILRARRARALRRGRGLRDHSHGIGTRRASPACSHWIRSRRAMVRRRCSSRASDRHR